MRREPKAPEKGYSVFCVVDNTHRVMSAEIINIPAKFIKNKNSANPVINSCLIDEAFKLFIDNQVAKLASEYPEDDFKIYRYDFPFGANIALKETATDLENYQEVFQRIIEQDSMPPCIETTLKFETAKQASKNKNNVLIKDYPMVTEKNIIDLLTQYKTNTNIVLPLLMKFFSNPYLSPTNSEEIIAAIRETDYYKNLNHNDTTDLKKIGKIHKLHLYFAHLRNQREESKILHDLITFQISNNIRDCANIITAYKDDSEVTEKLIRICAIEVPKINGLDTFINAFKESKYYKDHLQGDPVKSLCVDPFQLLLAEDAIDQAYNYKRTHNTVSIKEYRETYLSLIRDGYQNWITTELQLLMQERPEKSEETFHRLSKLEKNISSFSSIDNSGTSTLYNEKLKSISNYINGLATWPDIKQESPRMITFDIQNKKSILQTLAGEYRKQKETGVHIYHTGFSTQYPDRKTKEHEFLQMNHRCQIKKPVFIANFSYDPSVQNIEPIIIRHFTTEFMENLGYGSTPFITSFNEQEGTFSILSLNIRKTDDACYPICTVMNYINSGEIITKLEEKFGLCPNQEKQEAEMQGKEVDGQAEELEPQAEETQVQANISTYLKHTAPEENPEKKEHKKSNGKKK